MSIRTSVLHSPFNTIHANLVDWAPAPRRASGPKLRAAAGGAAAAGGGGALRAREGSDVRLLEPALRLHLHGLHGQEGTHAGHPEARRRAPRRHRRDVVTEVLVECDREVPHQRRPGGPPRYTPRYAPRYAPRRSHVTSQSCRDIRRALAKN